MSRSTSAAVSVQRERSDWRLNTPGLLAKTPGGSVVRVLNVSRDGFCLETVENLMIGIALDLHLALVGGELEVEGRIVWSRRVGDETLDDGRKAPVFRAGFAFADTRTSAEAALDRILQRYRRPPS